MIARGIGGGGGGRNPKILVGIQSCVQLVRFSTSTIFISIQKSKLLDAIFWKTLLTGGIFRYDTTIISSHLLRNISTSSKDIPPPPLKHPPRIKNTLQKQQICLIFTAILTYNDASNSQ
ncbi:hypothetical protein CEXT_13051 [Caerostris extrusa]|uniref:Uncharacterized protein n=1 Tax=Caerostris extrusa TaxID=172846 RepID=A0AAV4VB34_CAEEX|nr:hypothetical protein CEXT_13051 [Caerostris extrusa]